MAVKTWVPGNASGQFSRSTYWNPAGTPVIGDTGYFNTVLTADRTVSGTIILPSEIEIIGGNNNGSAFNIYEERPATGTYTWTFSPQGSPARINLVEGANHIFNIGAGSSILFPSDVDWGQGGINCTITKRGPGTYYFNRRDLVGWSGDFILEDGVLDGRTSSNSLQFGTGSLVVNTETGSPRLNFLAWNGFAATFRNPITFLGTQVARWTAYGFGLSAPFNLTYPESVNFGDADVYFDNGHSVRTRGNFFDGPIYGSSIARIYFTGNPDFANEQTTFFRNSSTGYTSYRGEIYINYQAILALNSNCTAFKHGVLYWQGTGRLVSDSSFYIGSIQTIYDFPLPGNMYIGEDLDRSEFTTSRLVRGVDQSDLTTIKDGSVYKIGNTTWTINGDNSTITGSFTISGGGLRINYNNSLGSSTSNPVSVQDTGTFIVNCASPANKNLSFNSSPSMFSGSSLVIEGNTTLNNFTQISRATTFWIKNNLNLNNFSQQGFTLYLIDGALGGTTTINSSIGNGSIASQIASLKIAGTSTPFGSYYLANNYGNLLLNNADAASAFAINQVSGSIYTENQTIITFRGFNDCSATISTTNSASQAVTYRISQVVGNGVYGGTTTGIGSINLMSGGGVVDFTGQVDHTRTGATTISNTGLRIRKKSLLKNSSSITITAGYLQNISSTPSDPVTLQTKTLNFNGGVLNLT